MAIRYMEGNLFKEIIMFFAIMLVCSPLNLVHHGNECFGVKDTNGYYLTKDKCKFRINEMEAELLNSLNFPVIISKNCVKVNLKSV